MNFRFVRIANTSFFSIAAISFVCCFISSNAVAQWQNAGQVDGISVWRDSQTGLEWTVTIGPVKSSGLGKPASDLVTKYGFRLPSFAELQTMEANGGFHPLKIRTRSQQYYETSDPKILAAAWGNGFKTPQRRIGRGENWVVGVRQGNGGIKSVDLRNSFESHGLSIRNQNIRDTCSVFAITALAEYEYVLATGRTKPFSEEYVNWAADEATGQVKDGGMFYEIVRGIQRNGVCSQEHMPYSQTVNSNIQPSEMARRDAEANKSWSERWIRRWHLKTGLSAKEINEVKASLTAGHPVAIGFCWQKDHQDLNKLIEPPPTNDVYGGHSVLIIGFDDIGGYFIFRNSWGTDYGESGYGRISYKYASQYGNDTVGLRFISSSSIRLEGEFLKVLDSRKCGTSVQNMEQYGLNLWSNRAQLFGFCEKDGYVELTFPVDQQGNYRVVLHATCAPDFGIGFCEVDGRPAVASLDFYGGKVFPSGPFELGNFSLGKGEHRLRLTIKGKNDYSSNYRFGIDFIELVRLPSP